MIDASDPSIFIKNGDFELWLHEISNLPKSVSYNLENDGIEAEHYVMFFGIRKEHFDDLVQYLTGIRLLCRFCCSP